MRRTALIEVGSNMIRYMVADYSGALDFVTVSTDTALHSIHPNAPTESAVVEANHAVEAFLADAEAKGCQTILAYGTAACRTVSERLPGILSPRIRVLTSREEALAGWVAGFACTSMTDGTSCTVIDEGSGSTEIVRATWSGSDFEDVSYYSAHIGSVALLEAYKNSPKGHLERTQHVIAAMCPDFEAAGLSPGSHGRLFMIGGVATSLGWLAAKGSGMQNYRPHEINGVRLTMAMMDDLYARLARAWRHDPRAARLAVDTRKGSEDHILKLLSSLPFLVVLARHLDPTGPYYVSGMGVRHGMGFMLWHGLLD